MLAGWCKSNRGVLGWLCLWVLAMLPLRADVLDHWSQGQIGSDIYSSVAFGNNLFVAVGYNGEVRVSGDAFTWTNQTFDTSMESLSIAYANGAFVAAGDYPYVTGGNKEGALQTSANGVNWTLTHQSGYCNAYYDVAFLNNTFVAVGDLGHVSQSADGSNWGSVDSRGAWTDTFNGVAYGHGVYVVVAPYGRILTSPVNPGITTGYLTPTSQNLQGIVFGNGQFVVVGNSGTILTSPDGTNWTAQVSGTANALNAVIYAAGFYVVVGANGTVLSSPDGVTWTARNPGTSNTLRGVTYGLGHFVAVGVAGTIAISTDETPPAITVPPQPASTSIPQGSNITYSVTATGAPTLTYQWQLNGRNISGANSSTYNLVNAQVKQSGTYTVVVKNSYGTNTSAGAVLTVVPPDLKPPKVKLVSPKPNQKWNVSLFLLQGTASDNVAVASVVYSLNSAPWAPASSVDNWKHWSATVVLVPGLNTVEAAAVDTSGNLTYSKLVQFNYTP